MTRRPVIEERRYWLSKPDQFHRETFDALRDLKIERWCRKRLKPSKRALRKHSKKHLAQIEASLRRFGWIVPIIINSNGEIICGYARYVVASRMGIAELPVIRLEHLSETDIRLFRLAETRLGELSEWDEEVLALEFAELSAPELQLDLDVTGFETRDIDRILDFRVVDQEEDALPPLPSRPVSVLGDLWRLDQHALLCGDALERTTYLRLLGNEQAQMVFTDPPYNCKIQGHARAKKGSSREFVMASGEMSLREFKNFLSTSMAHFADWTRDGAILYVCMDFAHMVELLAAAMPIFGKPKNLCVWAKDNAGMGSFYRSQHELVFVYKNGDAPHINNFGLGEHGRYRTNVWKYPGANAGPDRAETLAMHPTVKPTALVVDAIKDCSHRHGLILDPFAGSGTTVLACERTGRRARVAELDPVYVDLIVQRWQQATGKTAIHADSGKSFADVANERGHDR
jgi:DNA modification methylase